MIGVPLCIVVGVYCLSRRSNRPVQTLVVATSPRPRTTTAVTSSQAETSTAAPVQYPLQPVYKDAQLSYQDAPPSYTDAIAYPQAAQVKATIHKYTDISLHRSQFIYVINKPFQNIVANFTH